MSAGKKFKVQRCKIEGASKWKLSILQRSTDDRIMQTFHWKEI